MICDAEAALGNWDSHMHNRLISGRGLPDIMSASEGEGVMEKQM